MNSPPASLGRIKLLEWGHHLCLCGRDQLDSSVPCHGEAKEFVIDTTRGTIPPAVPKKIIYHVAPCLNALISVLVSERTLSLGTLHPFHH